MLRLSASAITPGAKRRCCGTSLLQRGSVAVQLLHPLAALLRLDRKRCHRTGQETRYADRLAGFLAIAVRAVLDHLDRLLDLLEQLALAIARAQFECVFLFERRAVRWIRRDLVFAQVLAGIVGVT